MKTLRVQTHRARTIGGGRRAFRAAGILSLCAALGLGGLATAVPAAADEAPVVPPPPTPEKPLAPKPGRDKPASRPANPTDVPMPSPAKPPMPNQPDDGDKGKPDGDQPEKDRPGNKPADAGKPADKDFPSPAELMKKLKADRDRKAKQAHVVLFDLTDPIGERAADFSLFGDFRLNLRSLTERLEKVRTDKNVKAVLITLGNPGVSLAQAQEIRDAMAAVVKAGKPVFVHADQYDTTLYTLATGASDVCILEGGELMMPGIGIEQMFLKGLFDKVGLKADYVQIGEYKGADEQYTRTGATEELKGEMRRLIDGLYGEIVAGIAEHRKIDPEVVKQSIDDSMVSGKTAKARKLVDHLTDQDGLRELVAKKLGGGEINLDPFYGVQRPDPVDFSNPFGLLASLTKKQQAEQPTNKPAVAVIYAEGVIVDGESSDGLFSEGGDVGSENMRKAFRTALRDDNVKAVVIRIDSPGGSALASEVMWQAARRLAAKKPVIISIGGMAASGGYYLASAGETIYADPTAIVGSIGVVGGKFVMQGLYDLAGVKTETFSKGRNADLFSSNQPFTDRQRVMVTTWMKSTYDQFTQRVMTTRKDKIQDIDRVARGRIFVARQAKDLGMVDEIGGIQAAIAAAAKKGGLKPDGFDVRQVPSPKTLGDYLSGNGGDGPQAQAALPTVRPTIEVKLDVKLEALLNTLSPALRQQAVRQLQVMRLLQDRPVMLVSPYTVTVK